MKKIINEPKSVLNQVEVEVNEELELTDEELKGVAGGLLFGLVPTPLDETVKGIPVLGPILA